MNEPAAAPQPKELKTLETNRQIAIARFSPCGKILAAGCYDAAIRRWDFSGDEPQELQPLLGHGGWTGCLAFAPQGDVVYSADSWGRLSAWPYAAENPEPTWTHAEAHAGWLRGLTVSPDGQQLATCGIDKIIRLWNAADGKLVREYAGHEHDVYAIAISPNHRQLVSGDLQGNVKRWDLQTGKVEAEARFEKMHYASRDAEVSGLRLLQYHGEKTLICAGSEPSAAGRMIGVPTIYFLDRDSLELKRTVQLGEGPDGYVFDLVWRQAGNHFLAATSGQPGKGKFMVLEAEAEEPAFVHTKLSNVHSVALHPDQQIAAVASTNRSSQGNGAVLDKEGNYVGNSSPVSIFEL